MARSSCQSPKESSRIRRLACAASFVLVAHPACGEVVQISDFAILIDGPVTIGDYQDLVSITTNIIETDAFTSSKLPPNIGLYLNSPGGDVEEALKIANFVREMWISTWVVDIDYDRSNTVDDFRRLLWGTPETKTDARTPLGDGDAEPIICFSACSLIFLSGIQRFYAQRTDRLVQLGFHRPYIEQSFNRQLTADQSRQAYGAIEVRYKDAMKQFGAPDSLISLTFNAASSDMTVLSIGQFYDLMPTDEPWFREYISAQCGNVPSGRIGSDREARTEFGRSVFVRSLCQSVFVNFRQQEAIKNFNKPTSAP